MKTGTGWRDKRRRQRVWYKHYRLICDNLYRMMRNGKMKASDIVIMFYDLYELRRLHRRRKTAESALESLLLALKDSGIDEDILTVMPRKRKMNADLVRVNSLLTEFNSDDIMLGV